MANLSSFFSSGSSSADPRTYKNYQEYTSPGSYTWTAPAGVTSVRAIVVGGGGSGARGEYNNGGGGGGGFAMGVYTVVPGTNYAVTVGSGGSRPGSGSGGNAGGTSSFASSQERGAGRPEGVG